MIDDDLTMDAESCCPDCGSVFGSVHRCAFEWVRP